MKTWVALLRGINVGGRHKVKMVDLRRDLAASGFQDVQTYIQSGNVVFRAGAVAPAGLSRRIQSTIAERHGFEPAVQVMDSAHFNTVVTENPFARIEDRKSVHVLFLSAAPDPACTPRLQALAIASERFSLGRHALYMHAPDGIARSRLAAGAEKALEVSGTARNLRTVEKILALAVGESPRMPRGHHS